MSKKLSRKELAETIARMIHEGDTDNLANEIAAFLIEQRGTKELDSLMRDVMQVRAETYGITEATAITAHPLTSEVKADIKSYLQAKQLILNEEQDSRLVGGLKLESADTQLDVSIHSRLNKLKQLVNEA